jgi:PAS domain S-box-containing protein
MKTALRLESSMATDPGLVRKVNEDSLGSREPASALERVGKGAIWVIADGVGTQSRGLAASRQVTDSVVDGYWNSAIPDPIDRLRSAIDRTNATLHVQNSPDARQQDLVGATCLAAVILEDNLYIAHVGRSRAYRFRAGQLLQLTADHTWVADQIRAGAIAPAEAVGHPRRNVITRCLGIKDTIRIDSLVEPLEPDDLILLCSDGLHRHLGDDQIAQLLLQPTAGVAAELVAAANRLGGQDNITAVVVRACPLEDDTDTAVDRVALLNRVARELSMTLDLDSTFASVLKQLIIVTGGERAALLLEDDGKLVPRAGYNIGNAAAGVYSQSVANQAMSERKPVLISNALDSPDFNPSASIVDMSLRSIICVPMIVKEDAIGVLYVDSSAQPGALNETDLDLVVSFAGLAATAVENARLHDDLLRRTRELELVRARQDSLVRSLSSGLVAVDNDGVITHWNPAAADILGVPTSAAIGARPREVLPPGIASWLSGLALQVELQGHTFMTANEWEGPVGGRGRVIIAGRVARIRDNDNSAEGTVFVLNDRTDVVLLEEARRQESVERERMRQLFQRYLAPPLVERLLHSPEAVQLGGSRQDVTILFADVRGFTGFSEQHTPEQVVEMLNSYLALATTEIFNEFGTLDKFIGDGVMAIFGAPVPVQDREMAAVRAALAMRDGLDSLRQDTGARVGFGVGLNAGPAIVGNIGTSQLMNYTAIGDVVNVAARLQAEARSGEILISDSVLERVADRVRFEELGQVYVKGRAVPVTTYKLLGLIES